MKNIQIQHGIKILLTPLTKLKFINYETNKHAGIYDFIIKKKTLIKYKIYYSILNYKLLKIIYIIYKLLNLITNKTF